MKHLKHFVSTKYFIHAYIGIDIDPEAMSSEQLQQLQQHQKSLCKVRKLRSKDKLKKIIIEFNIPTWEKLEKSYDEFNIIFAFLKQTLKEKVLFRSRVLFEYCLDEYETEPEIPIILEEKWGKVGRLELSGMRVSFPDYSEIDSVILDTVPCPGCGKKALVVSITSTILDFISPDLLKRSIEKSEKFSRNFLKNKK